MLTCAFVATLGTKRVTNAKIAWHTSVFRTCPMRSLRRFHREKHRSHSLGRTFACAARPSKMVRRMGNRRHSHRSLSPRKIKRKAWPPYRPIKGVGGRGDSQGLGIEPAMDVRRHHLLQSSVSSLGVEPRSPRPQRGILTTKLTGPARRHTKRYI